MQIFVHSLTGKKITVNVDSMDTVESLKQKITEKVDYDYFGSAQIIFAGKS